MPKHNYVATGVVRETGAVLTERIAHCDKPLAVRIAKVWAAENALRLVLVERLQPVWVHGRDE